MIDVRISREKVIRISLREALLKLDMAQSAAPSDVAQRRLAAIVSDLRAVLASLGPDPDFPPR